MLIFRTAGIPATGAEAIREWRQHLRLVAGAVVRGSSDGTTYKTVADQISHGGSGAGGLANSSAWFCLRLRTGRSYCVQRGTTNREWRVKESLAAGFSGGTPDATQVPSAADEAVLLGGGTDAAPTFAKLFDADGSFVFNVFAQDTAPYGFGTYCWSTAGTPPNQPTYAGILMLDPVTGTLPGDPDPYVLWVVGAGAGLPYQYTSLSTVGGGLTGGIYGRDLVGTMSALAASTLTSDAVLVFPGNMASNPWTGEEESVALPYAVRSGFWKGVSTFARWSGAAHLNAEAVSVSGSDDLQYVALGDVLLPWTAS